MKTPLSSSAGPGGPACALDNRACATRVLQSVLDSTSPIGTAATTAVEIRSVP